MSVNGVSSNTYLNYARRIGRVYLHSTFGTGMEEFMTSMDKSIFGKCAPKKHWYSLRWDEADWSNLGGKFKDGFKSIEKHEAALRKAHGGSWLKSFWHQVRTIPEIIGNERKAGVAAAKLAGKSAFWGGFKGFGDGLMKRMPLIGGLIAVATQVPNIISAFKDGGVGTGIAELGKAAGKLGLETAGFMVGQALIPIPIVGGIIGSIAAGWLGEKILGKSFTEKQEEAQGEKPAVPGWVPFVADNRMPQPDYGSGGGGYPAWTPIAPTMTDEEIYRMGQYLQRGLT